MGSEFSVAESRWRKVGPKDLSRFRPGIRDIQCPMFMRGGKLEGGKLFMGGGKWIWEKNLGGVT